MEVRGESPFTWPGRTRGPSMESCMRRRRDRTALRARAEHRGKYAAAEIIQTNDRKSESIRLFNLKWNTSAPLFKLYYSKQMLYVQQSDHETVR